MTPHRFIGIDEAGYGPNLGPLVMAAVIAEAQDDREPDVWADLAASVSRAGGPVGRLWVDDSKRVLKGRSGRDRLFETAMASLVAARHQPPGTMSQWLSAVNAGSLAGVELSRWLEPDHDPPAPVVACLGAPLACERWKIIDVRAVVAGPERFNAELASCKSKADAHFQVFAQLLRPIWAQTELPTLIRSDKHGGRHFYLGPLSEALPDAWIERGEEGPNLSRYLARDGSRRLNSGVPPPRRRRGRARRPGVDHGQEPPRIVDDALQRILGTTHPWAQTHGRLPGGRLAISPRDRGRRRDTRIGRVVLVAFALIFRNASRNSRRFRGRHSWQGTCHRSIYDTERAKNGGQ